jgi:hypothetical protein
MHQVPKIFFLNCCFAVHFNKYNNILPTNALFAPGVIYQVTDMVSIL